MKLSNIYYYLQGNLRYKLFYSIFAFMIPRHIYEQIEVRIRSMDKDCYNNGVCKLCGCTTTALQMANKACEKPCYPPMLSKENWKTLKQGKILFHRHLSKMIYGWKLEHYTFKRLPK